MTSSISPSATAPHGAIPFVIDVAFAVRHMVYLSLSWDHRLIDGALASQFLSRVKQNLETWDFAEDLAL